MSEVQARSQPASRGRGGGRGGRGGFAPRSEGRTGNTRRANGDKSAASDSLDEDGDIGQLRQQHGDKLDTIKNIFPDWSDADILYALQENEGDVEVVATKISDGTISQWGEVSKPKKISKPKAKDAAPSTGLTDSSGAGRPGRGGRIEGGRGGRGARGSERARGGRGRGASTQPATNGHRTKDNQQLSVPTEEASAWGTTPSTDDTTANEWGTTGWGSTDTTKETTTTTTATPEPSTTTAPTTTAEPAVPKPKTWASMLRQSTQPKVAPKPQEAPAPKAAETVEAAPPTEPTPAEPEPVVEQTPEEPVEEPTPAPVAEEAPKIVEPEVALPPSEDDLTKNNLAQLPDESNPPATATVASTTADSWDPRQTAAQSATATPLSAAQAQHQAQASRPSASGFVTSALKATERPVRVPSYQRRLLEQEEAVRLPGNREVDRAAVQFGAFSLSGAEDDIDGDREEAETRAQPPSDSPIQPRASLPPPVAQPTQPTAVPDAFPAATAQKPAATLPQPAGAAGRDSFRLETLRNTHADPYTAPSVAPPTGPAAGAATHRMSQYPQAYAPPANIGLEPFNQQYSRFGQAAAQDQSSFPPKPYDTFGQQPAATTAAGFDSFPAPSTQPPSQPSGTTFSSAPSDYSSYYTADQHGRGSYNNSYYGQGYNQQQGAQGHNEGPNSHQRPFGGYNASQNSDNLSQYPQSAAQQSRYGANAAADAHNSGHNTPNPTGPSQQQPAAQNSGPQSNLHQQQQQGPAGGFPYQHPYQNSPFYSQYMNYYGGYGQGGYGGGPYGKGGVYGQPHQYQHSPYEHNSSPATSGFAQSSLGGRDSGLGSSIDNYGRAGSAQSGAQGLGNSGFGGAHDAFNRAGSSYQSQAGQGFNGPSAQGGSASDDLKPYGDSKATGGPSPSLGGGARPGSATNNTPGQSGLPPPQSSAQGMGGYGGYPSHLQGHGLHGNQTGGSGFGQGHNNYGGGYGNYAGNQGFGSYGRGWGSNYQ
ncbi:rnapii degradation factor def1 [Seiridium cupressi]